VTEFERKLFDLCEWAELDEIRAFKEELGSLLDTIADRVRDEVPVQSRGEDMGKTETLLKLREIAKEIHDDESA
jgi:uncharacterized NAD-dependent epimerase/dehydratase family protein